MLNLNIDKTWTLFLDRDGVINHEKHLDYINYWDEFVFYKGVKQALKTFNELFGHIIVITNQRGVGKGITTEKNLHIIHRNMQNEIEFAGGRIDAVYFAPDLDNNSPNRKPNTGMALQAKQDFPPINFEKSIMVGNTLSDMEFGRNIGATTIFLPTTLPGTAHDDKRIDAVFSSLLEFSKSLKQ